jgi:hypothetical protein
MNVTEDQAKTLICPVRNILAQDEYPSTAPFSPQSDFHVVPRCKASTCMMWRWQTRSGVISATDGYCGLAGAAGAP